MDAATAPAGVNPTDFKTELLSSLREEMASILKSKLQAAMSENLSFIKLELHMVKTELTSSIASIKTDVNMLKSAVGEMETSLLALMTWLHFKLKWRSCQFS